jgi:methylenetetrahydrofolate reductase (NADPH)
MIIPLDPAGPRGPAHAPASQRPVRVSFEVFPPKSATADAELWPVLGKLAALGPEFVSVTCGAGGGTRGRTEGVVQRLRQETGAAPAAHLTCIGVDRGEIGEALAGYWRAGVRHIVALRGDPPGGPGAPFTPVADGFANATELVAAVARAAPFEISVAAYPETHPESPSAAHDIDVLKAKRDAGATRALTQFFFDPDAFFRFVDRAEAAGLDLPIVPGILPVSNVAAARRMAATCGAAFPDRYDRLFDGLDEDPETRRLLASALAVELCGKLHDQGFRNFHFYTLNRADLSYAVCRALGLRPAPAAQAA